MPYAQMCWHGLTARAGFQGPGDPPVRGSALKPLVEKAMKRAIRLFCDLLLDYFSYSVCLSCNCGNQACTQGSRLHVREGAELHR